MGHLVHRFEEGETQHEDLILSYAKHEQQLQVSSAAILTHDSTHQIHQATFKEVV